VDRTPRGVDGGDVDRWHGRKCAVWQSRPRDSGWYTPREYE
jgi:hypothetical protein